METLELSIDKIFGFVPEKDIYALKSRTQEQLSALHLKQGKGSDFLGWVDLPSQITGDTINSIKQAAQSLKDKTEIVVVIGIGGSYLGAKAVIDSLSSSFSLMQNTKGAPHILYAGQNIGEDYLAELLDVLTDKSFGIVVISKSGTTTEPAIAFRILKNLLEQKVGKSSAKEYIIAITDEKKGALRSLADKEGYMTFVIPDDIGGRYSVLTPVGLIPIAIAGADIKQLVQGAQSMLERTGPNVEFENNPASLYAATRYSLYKSGKVIEILVNYHNKLTYFSEWWKQLYGESEGKDQKGIFPASVNFTTDLHSMGQYIQEGERNLFETVLSVNQAERELSIPADEENLDGLNYLSQKRIDHVNKMAELGTLLAHVSGGVPNMQIRIPRLTEYYIGQLIYFFEKACGISGYLLGVNPFDQPGVEAYKKNMFALLKKPGFEKETEEINKLL